MFVMMLICVQPITGRTHQIRVHLQWLGHPIANDPNYGAMLTAPTPDDAARTAPATAASDAPIDGGEEGGTDADVMFIPHHSAAVSSDAASTEPVHGIAEYTGGHDAAMVASLKLNCKYCRGLGDKGLFSDVQLRHEGIYLHALAYEVIVPYASTHDAAV